MKINRKFIILLITINIGIWGFAYTLRDHRIHNAPLEFHQPILMGIQLDVGQGDAFLLVSPDHQVTIIDGGPAMHARARTWDSGLQIILPVLQGLGIKKVDKIFISHHDEDHLGGIVSLIKAFPVGEVFDNGNGELTQTFRDFQDAIARYHVPLRTLKEGDALFLGDGVYAQVLLSSVNPGLDENNTCLVLRISFGKLNMLFTGDIESLAELGLCQRYGQGLHCEYLKVPHHGSKSSSSYPLLKMTRPAVAGISVGKHNSYGHPAPITLKRYKEYLKSEVLRTDEDGGILLVSNGTDCFFATQRGKMERIIIK